MSRKPRFQIGYSVEITKHNTFNSLGNGTPYQGWTGKVVFSTIALDKDKKVQEQVTIHLNDGPTVIVQTPKDALYIIDRHGIRDEFCECCGNCGEFCECCGNCGESREFCECCGNCGEYNCRC
jgi:hypothetical protein